MRHLQLTKTHLCAHHCRWLVRSYTKTCLCTHDKCHAWMQSTNIRPKHTYKKQTSWHCLLLPTHGQQPTTRTTTNNTDSDRQHGLRPTHCLALPPTTRSVTTTTNTRGGDLVTNSSTGRERSGALRARAASRSAGERKSM
jgi:hypothetical protein